MRQIADLYAVEGEIKGMYPSNRLALRATRSAPLVAGFGEWLAAGRARISRKPRLGERLAYIANQWASLQLFLRAGRVEMDGNPVENMIRPSPSTEKTHYLLAMTKAAQLEAASPH